MHFKHPEILNFLFLLIVPILVHLFQFRRFKKEYFTNVQFLKELSIQTRKSSQLKKYLLLMSRLLLLSCLIVAFAQPYYDAADQKNSSNEMFIILDNSFSMQAKGKKGELLKRVAQELLEEIPENTTFSLLTNTDSYWNTDIKAIRSSLQNINYSATAFELTPILNNINAHYKNANKDIIIITDGLDLKKNQLKSIDKDDVPFFIIPKAEKKNNIAIDSVYINETTDNFYDIAVELSAYGHDFKPIAVAIYNQGKLIAKSVANLENKKKTLNFSIPKQPFHGYISISDNGLDYDNNYFFDISDVRKINVISIGNSAKSNFLGRIYTQDEFNYFNSELETLDYNILEKQDVIILNELDEIPQALQLTLKAFVGKGGNLILIPGAKTAISDLNNFLSNFGKIQFRTYEKSEKLITKINFSHPLYKSVFENKVSNFQYPKTNASFSLTTANPGILYNNDQSIFLTSLPNSLSNVYVFSAPINSSNSNFQLSPLIVPTFYKMGINTQKTGINTNEIGSTISFIVAISLAKDAVLEVKNEREQFIPIQQLINNKVKLQFGNLPQQAGNFEIYSQKDKVGHISFNYQRTESDLADFDSRVLSDYKTMNSVASIFDHIQSERTDNQIWKWFVIFALLFLLSEIAIIKFLK